MVLAVMGSICGVIIRFLCDFLLKYLDTSISKEARKLYLYISIMVLNILNKALGVIFKR